MFSIFKSVQTEIFHKPNVAEVVPGFILKDFETPCPNMQNTSLAIHFDPFLMPKSQKCQTFNIFLFIRGYRQR